MALCYWKVCDCPDATPCAQHSGVACGTHDGHQIDKAEQVGDAVTHRAELALMKMEDDKARVNQIAARLEARRDELQRVQADIEQRLRAADSYAKRRDAIAFAKQKNKEYADLDRELKAVLSDLDMLENSWRWEGNVLASRLVVPYVDPSAYCSCYDVKKQRLAVINGLCAPHLAEIGLCLAEIAKIRTELQPGFTQFNTLKKGFSVVAAATILVFLITGTVAAATWALLVGLIAVAILLIIAHVRLADLRRRILLAQIQIMKLNLHYYRTQQIATCLPAKAGATAPGGDWWDEVWELFENPLAPFPPTPPPEHP